MRRIAALPTFAADRFAGDIHVEEVTGRGKPVIRSGMEHIAVINDHRTLYRRRLNQTIFFDDRSPLT